MSTRRQFNQAVFEKIWVSERGVEGVQFTDGFWDILEVGDRSWSEWPTPNSRHRTHKAKHPKYGERGATVLLDDAWNVERLVEVTWR